MVNPFHPRGKGADVLYGFFVRFQLKQRGTEVEVQTLNFEVGLCQRGSDGLFCVASLDRESKFGVQDARAGEAMSVRIDAGRDAQVDGLSGIRVLRRLRLEARSRGMNRW